MTVSSHPRPGQWAACTEDGEEVFRLIPDPQNPGIFKPDRPHALAAGLRIVMRPVEGS